MINKMPAPQLAFAENEIGGTRFQVTSVSPTHPNRTSAPTFTRATVVPNIAPLLTPRILMTARTAETLTSTKALPIVVVAAGVKYPRYETSRLVFAANALKRDNHIAHPTSNP